MAIISTILESAFNSPTVRTHHGDLRAEIGDGFGASEQGRGLTDDLAVVSLTFASLSLILTLSTFYWFVKMRKTFRHELIVLLIQSDLIKSVWFVIPSIVHLVRGPLHSDSALCQIAGFGLALGIEASDIAVLLIAIHLLMTILRLRTGLYRYRYWAYGAYCFFPVLFASLAFVDGTGYQEAGHYCYLRTDKSWARRALSWVPRYIICCSILAIYLFVYFYVRSRLEDYGRRSSGNMNHPHSRDTDDVPPTPRLISHGLLASLPNSRRGSAADQNVAIKDRNRSLSSISTLQFELHVDEAGEQPVSKGRRSLKHRPAKMNWNWPGFVPPRSSWENGRLMVEDWDDSMSQPLPSPPLPVHSPERPPRASRSDNSSASPRSYWHRPVASKCSTVHGNHASHDLPPSSTNTANQGTYHIDLTLTHILTMLRKGPPRTSNTPPTTRPSSMTISPDSISGDSGVTRNRERARRQLYALFAYPLVYIIVWIFPFLSHVGYDDKITPNDPQWILFVSMVSLGIQGTVDCMLFTLREQPWKHAHGDFWTALRARMRFSGSWRDVGFAGRTREEMFHDSQLARKRREQEIADERARRAVHGVTQQGADVETGAGGPRGAATRKTGAVEWWDTADLLDGMIDDDEELRDDADDDFWAQLYRLNGD
ncbi:G protein-coupled glucose receptor regulating Gpa2 domain-containing protein [Neurospora intermedia]|uniref:G protein-coupled glucose receptor regulating Gpa2 domain-containing protein n=1 Tax=Neurospora intermedia TaxID=5142 RepID=A0ABR3DHN0_NEUIN